MTWPKRKVIPSVRTGYAREREDKSRRSKSVRGFSGRFAVADSAGDEASHVQQAKKHGELTDAHCVPASLPTLKEPRGDEDGRGDVMEESVVAGAGKNTAVPENTATHVQQAAAREKTTDAPCVLASPNNLGEPHDGGDEHGGIVVDSAVGDVLFL